MFHFFKISLIPVSGFRGLFSVQGMELIFTNRKRDSGARFSSPQICVLFTQTVNRLPHRLWKRQSLSTTVLFRTTLTRTIDAQLTYEIHISWQSKQTS